MIFVPMSIILAQAQGVPIVPKVTQVASGGSMSGMNMSGMNMSAAAPMPGQSITRLSRESIFFLPENCLDVLVI